MLWVVRKQGYLYVKKVLIEGSVEEVKLKHDG